jgi:hypothetical protein
MKFSISTSLRFAISMMISRPSGLEKSTAIERLLRLAPRKKLDSRDGLPFSSGSHAGP